MVEVWVEQWVELRMEQHGSMAVEQVYILGHCICEGANHTLYEQMQRDITPESHSHHMHPRHTTLLLHQVFIVFRHEAFTSSIHEYSWTIVDNGTKWPCNKSHTLTQLCTHALENTHTKEHCK